MNSNNFFRKSRKKLEKDKYNQRDMDKQINLTYSRDYDEESNWTSNLSLSTVITVI